MAGGVRTADHLRREWMEMRHHIWLATTEHMQSGEANSMTGANMAFHRKVLERVPAFDPELGPGALGMNEEYFFAIQMLTAGFRIISAYDIIADHHFSESRLGRPAFLRAVELSARSTAYISHHWEHEEQTHPRRYTFKKLVKLNLYRILRRRELAEQVLPMWEERVLYDYCFMSQYLIESRRPRNYERHGLVKLRGEGAKN